MPVLNQDQWTKKLTGYQKTFDTSLSVWIEAFLVDRKSQNFARGTLYFYQKKLAKFMRYCDNQVITDIHQVTSTVIREYLLWLRDQGNNPGGVHCFYRALKTFLLWYELETEPENWSNPIRKIKAPKIPQELLEPITPETINKLLTACNQADWIGERDKAVILFLFDTGCRAAEFCALDLGDYDTVTGQALIRQGKGRKPRTVFIGSMARRQMRRYLKHRLSMSVPKALWLAKQGGRLAYDGLRQIIRRRAAEAGIPMPTLHAFRRGFALSMLRNGVDVYSLSALMGHADLQILKRYLKQDTQDLRAAHERGSPVDNLL